VYKLFKNGKRAKAPFHVFEYDDPESVEEHFNEHIKGNFSDKVRRSKMIVLRSDLPQERQDDLASEEDKTYQKNRNRVFRKLIKNLDDTTILSETQFGGGLIFCRESNWQWQWAVLESSTSRYLAGLSPTFPGYNTAQQWMDNEIKKL
jgi:hypothetical protein